MPDFSPSGLCCTDLFGFTSRGCPLVPNLERDCKIWWVSTLWESGLGSDCGSCSLEFSFSLVFWIQCGLAFYSLLYCLGIFWARAGSWELVVGLSSLGVNYELDFRNWELYYHVLLLWMSKDPAILTISIYHLVGLVGTKDVSNVHCLWINEAFWTRNMIGALDEHTVKLELILIFKICSLDIHLTASSSAFPPIGLPLTFLNPIAYILC